MECLIHIWICGLPWSSDQNLGKYHPLLPRICHLEVNDCWLTQVIQQSSELNYVKAEKVITKCTPRVDTRENSSLTLLLRYYHFLWLLTEAGCLSFLAYKTIKSCFNYTIGQLRIGAIYKILVLTCDDCDISFWPWLGGLLNVASKKHD